MYVVFYKDVQNILIYLYGYTYKELILLTCKINRHSISKANEYISNLCKSLIYYSIA